MSAGTLYITGDAEADGLLNTDGTALLIGMLLDQQVPMEWAFAGPATLQSRLGHLDARRIAALDVEEFVAVCATKPAIHRFPASMGRRIHDVCVVLTERVRRQGRSDLGRRRTAAPSCTTACARCPATARRSRRSSSPSSASGWASHPTDGARRPGKFGDDVPRSVADIDGVETLGKVREWKKAQKAAKRDKQDRPMPS